MTIQNTGLRKAGPAQGNSVTTVFPFTFKVFSAPDIRVTYLDVNGTEITLTLSSDYTVALNADQNTSPGGSVNLLWVPTTGTYITLTSAVANTQNLLLTNSGGFYPSSINDALDRCVIQIQQLAEQLSRTFKVPVSSIIIAGNSVADYLTAAADSALAAATSASSAFASSTQSADFAASGTASALAASNSAIAAANSATTAITPTAVALAAYLDAFFPTAPPVTFTSIYVGGGWDMGTVVPSSPFTNETITRRVNLSSDSAASFDYGTVA